MHIQYANVYMASFFFRCGQAFQSILLFSVCLLKTWMLERMELSISQWKVNWWGEENVFLIHDSFVFISLWLKGKFLCDLIWDVLFFSHILLDNQLGHFSIDSRNGDVKVTSRFSSNPQMRYTLRVVATDNGLFPLEETAVVHIQVSEAGPGI